MADPNVGYATLQIIPSMRGAQAAITGQMAGPAAAAGQTAGRSMGSSMAGAIGSALKVGLGGAFVVGGVLTGLAKLGDSFDEAGDRIRVTTGATGDQLEALQGSFKDVFSSIPTDMTSASTAIGDLNQRLGLTGVPLERLSSQFLELSRITETDLASNIESVTRVFGDWGITVDDQGERLDSLFRASQATGIGVDTLSSQMVKFGAPLRQLGFSFDTTAGLLGKFEKEGVNAELVMGSMRIALGKMARAGEPAEETLRRVTEDIAKAGDASTANALALEVFGARAGPDMAAAIREGRFELGDLYETIAFGSETILGAAEDTNDWRESWEVLKNKALVGLEPIATRVFNALGTGMDWVSEKAPVFAAWFSENIYPALADTGRVLADLVRDGLGGIANWWQTNGATVLGGLSAAFDAISTAVIDYAWPAVKDFVEWISENEYRVTAFAVTVGTVLTAAMGAYAASALVAAGATIVATYPFILAGIAVGALTAATLWLAETFNDPLSGALQFVIDRFTDLLNIVREVTSALKSAWKWAGDVAAAIPRIPTMPDPTPGFDVPFVPWFDDGGVMPGRRGVHSLAWVAGGETILPTHKNSYEAAPTAPGGGGDITIQVIERPGENAGITAAREMRRLQLLAVH